MYINDRIPLKSKRKFTAEGFLEVPAHISRTGIQHYRAVEMGLTDRDPEDMIAVYRPDEEVFNPESLASFANKPVTDDHPPGLIDAATARKYSVGHSGPEVVRDGDRVRTTIHIIDAAAIEKIKSGKVELSNGYISDIEWATGISPTGEQYDAIQRNIRGNHIAIVDRGRAGYSCRLADHSPINEDHTMPMITIDGVDYEVPAQAAQAVVKLQARLTDAEKSIDAITKQVQDKEGEIETLKGSHQKMIDTMQAQIDAAADKVPDAATLDGMIDERITLIASASKLVPGFDWKGKDNATIRKEIVADKCKGVQLDSVSDEYIAARFDALTETGSKSDNSDLDRTLAAIVNNDSDQDFSDTCGESESEKARKKMIEDNRNRWKGGKQS